MIRSIPTALAITTLLIVSGCGHKAPSGQVAATVNDVEITRAQLLAEPAAREFAEGGDVDSALPKVLEAVINRQLAVAEARKLKLDQTQEYIIQQQRLSDELLSQMIIARWMNDAPAPTQAQIAEFIVDNPQMFAEHRRFMVDRIIADGTGIESNALAPLSSMDEIASYLTGIGHKFNRAQVQVDSAEIQPSLFKRLNDLPIGNPLAIREGNGLQIVGVRGVVEVPIAADGQQNLAIETLKRNAAVSRLLAARKAARLEYNAGFAPRK